MLTRQIRLLESSRYKTRRKEAQKTIFMERMETQKQKQTFLFVMKCSSEEENVASVSICGKMWGCNLDLKGPVGGVKQLLD